MASTPARREWLPLSPLRLPSKLTKRRESDDANFVNFCSGKTVTNGEMRNESSCSPIVMGDLPSTSNMISTVITYPQHGDILTADEDFTVKIATKNLHTGAFTNPFGTFYSAPQQLDDDGLVIGHAHLTVQSIGDMKSTTPPDPEEFAWFAGLNKKAEDGVLSANVDGGLPAGVYRLCTLVAAANHQPVLMPVAQRGAQDDCVRFEVKGGENASDQDSEAGGLYVEVSV